MRWISTFLMLLQSPFLYAADEKITAFVSVLPHAYFVERIGGSHVDVNVLVGPGESPELFNPRPKQVIALQNADVYFSTGMPFEEIWLPRIRSSNPDIKIVDLRDGIELLHIEDASVELSISQNAKEDHQHKHGDEDPHIWLDPLRAVKQVDTITQALIEVDQNHKSVYRENANVLQEELKQLHTDIETLLKPVKKRIMALFHPSWGYFADRYDLKQIAIETGGKEPSAKQLGNVIAYLKEQQIKTIFVQDQMDSRLAITVARQTGSKVVSIDPLAKDYISNLRKTAGILAKELQ